jgi:hypothetical protein
MKRIGIEVNGVLRDTFGKFRQIYEKHMIENYESENTNQTFTMDMSGNTSLDGVEDDFTYEIIEPIDTFELKNHFKFKSDEELYDFMFNDFPMQLFGHAGSTETFTFNDLNNFYTKNRDEYEIFIVSDEIGKSKPATLFFLSKFGCLIENIKFYSNSTLDNMWDTIDILLTSNPNLITTHPDNKVLVQYVTEYNKNINNKYKIDKLEDFDELIKQIKL